MKQIPSTARLKRLSVLKACVMVIKKKIVRMAINKTCTDLHIDKKI